MDKVLKAREVRYQFIIDKLKEYPIISVKANIPGTNKNKRFAYILVDLFKNIISSNNRIISHHFYESADGPNWLIEVDRDSSNLKLEMIKLEEEHSLGRLVDLDVYYKDQSLSRSSFQKPKRKCLLCNNDALICMRNKNHSTRELLTKIENMILSYIEKTMVVIVDDAITSEAKLDPKFGLVTINSNGSHHDMDYNLLMKSKEVILPHLNKMFHFGYKYNLDKAFMLSRKEGIVAEEEMFRLTSEVNTYKGLIFVLGIVLISLGHCFKEYQFNIYQNISYLGRNLLDEFVGKSEKTFGMEAFQKYQITGIRGEVKEGLPHVKEVLRILNNYQDETLLRALIYLISKVNDTVLLKRAKNIEKYQYYRNLIGNINEFDLEKINQITKECIKENLSFGGSADLLVVAIFMRKVEDEFKINYE